MHKLGLKEAEESEIKLPAFVGSWRKQGSFRKTSTSTLLTTPKPLTVWITTNCGKFLKEKEIPDHLTCFLRNLYAGKKQQLELDMEQLTGSKLVKEYVKAVYCHPDYLTYAEYIMGNARLDESQAEIKVARRNINNLRHADDTILMVERRGTKEPHDEGERGE